MSNLDRLRRNLTDAKKRLELYRAACTDTEGNTVMDDTDRDVVRKLNDSINRCERNLHVAERIAARMPEAPGSQATPGPQLAPTRSSRRT